MPDYEYTQTINASPDEVYAFVSNVENLPQYLPTTKSAQPQGEGRVRVQGEANGHQYDSDGTFTADASLRRLEWSADEANRYAGWLAITGQDATSQVTVHLTFGTEMDLPDRIEENSPSNRPIQEGIGAALRSIQNIVEGQGGKEEPAAAK
jgi:uncharacterized protein YndB with AHSA1/START domain